MNVVTLVGRLTRDGEYQETQTGMQVYRFSVAVDRETKKEGQPTADFPRVIVFGKSAENCNKFLSKGSMVGIVGRLQTGSYKDKNGNTVYTTDVIASRVDFLTPKDKGEKTVQEEFAMLDEAVPF